MTNKKEILEMNYEKKTFLVFLCLNLINYLFYKKEKFLYDGKVDLKIIKIESKHDISKGNIFSFFVRYDIFNIVIHEVVRMWEL